MSRKLGGSARALLLCLALVAPGCAPETPSPASPAGRIALDPDELERGRRLFLGTCTGYCHGSPRGGGRDAPDLFDCVWLHGSSDAEIFASISQGVAGTRMLAFGGSLPEDDLWRLVAFLRSASRCPQGPSN